MEVEPQYMEVSPAQEHFYQSFQRCKILLPISRGDKNMLIISSKTKIWKARMGPNLTNFALIRIACSLLLASKQILC